MKTQLSDDEKVILDYYRTLPKDRRASFRREIIFLKNTGKIPQAWKQAGFMEPTGGRYE
jgi:hypothetical protein